MGVAEAQKDANQKYEQANNAYNKTINAVNDLKQQMSATQNYMGRGQLNNRGEKVSYRKVDMNSINTPGGTNNGK